MSLVYITGISGSGKSTVRRELQKRGYTAYGVDEDGIAAFYHNDSGEKVGQADASARTEEWRARHSWRMPRETVEKLANEAEGKLAFLCGTVSNDQDSWKLFDKVIALTVDTDTLERRLTNRSENDFGKSEHERRMVLTWQEYAAEEYRRLGAMLVDSTRPLGEVVDRVLEIATR